MSASAARPTEVTSLPSGVSAMTWLERLESIEARVKQLEDLRCQAGQHGPIVFGPPKRSPGCVNRDRICTWCQHVVGVESVNTTIAKKKSAGKSR